MPYPHLVVSPSPPRVDTSPWQFSAVRADVGGVKGWGEGKVGVGGSIRRNATRGDGIGLALSVRQAITVSPFLGEGGEREATVLVSNPLFWME